MVIFEFCFMRVGSGPELVYPIQSPSPALYAQPHEVVYDKYWCIGMDCSLYRNLVLCLRMPCDGPLDSREWKPRVAFEIVSFD